MSNFFGRRAAAYTNELNRSFAGLLGIATGILADRKIEDSEVVFLKRWLDANEVIATTWPGDVIHARVNDILADGHVSEEERAHLMQVLQQLVGGTLDSLATGTHSTQMLAYSELPVVFTNSAFCLTGDFAYRPRARCQKEIQERGGIIKTAVSKKLLYLVVGGLGSPEWKHGSFGTKVEKAMELVRAGAKIQFVREDHWCGCLKSTPMAA